MNDLKTNVINAYGIRFGAEPDIVAIAPGRVNLIGEHTDYNNGFVLPVAIDREVVFACGKAGGNTITGYSLDFDDQTDIPVGSYDPTHPSGWLRYIMGVLQELEKDGRQVGGFRFTVGGNVPIGSGLSSSAALEMATCTAMEGLFGFSLSGKDAALLCQRAENKFVGVNCGIMDQYISRVGKKDHAVLIDCADLSINIIPINTPGYTWLIIDSNKRRGLVDSEYNRRREECGEGVKIAQKVFPGRDITSLRDLVPDDLLILEKACEPVVYRRVRHQVTENTRVLSTVKALRTGDIESIGKDLYGSHLSLRDDYEVSCAELDMLVNILKDVDGVAGARLTGAGFGGCVIACLKEEAVAVAGEAIARKYRPPTLPEGTSANIWTVKISDGARIADKA